MSSKNRLKEESCSCCYRIVDSPFGRVVLLADADGITDLKWIENEERPLCMHGTFIWTGGSQMATEHLTTAASQLKEYFNGERTEFTLRLNLLGTKFQQQAWKILQTIPYGQTISYSQQAKLLGDKNLSRAAGQANGANHIPIIIPCHRVVSSGGKLGGFSAGLKIKKMLLELEGNVANLG
jgi:O-6-methylguanine DNA methyltransferase